MALSPAEAKAEIKNASRPLALTFTKPSFSQTSFPFGAPPATNASGAAPFKFGVGATAPASSGAGSGSSAAMSLPTNLGQRERREKKKFRAGVTPGSVILCGSGDCGQLGLGMKKTDLNVPAHLSLLDRKSIVKVVDRLWIH